MNYRADGYAFFAAELGLFVNVFVWPFAGHSLWTSAGWLAAMVFTWGIQKWTNQ